MICIPENRFCSCQPALYAVCPVCDHEDDPDCWRCKNEPIPGMIAVDIDYDGDQDTLLVHNEPVRQ